MKVCPECGEVYPAQATTCRAHNIPLRNWGDSAEIFAAHTDVEHSRPDNPAISPPSPTDDHTAPEIQPGGGVSAIGITPAVQVDPEALLRPGSPRRGRTLGQRYRLDRQIGIGGYGAVFDAYDQRLRKRVAVKVLSPALSQSREEIERFRREAIAASQVRHEGIVDVTDLNRDADGTFYIVMEYLGGVDLGDVLDAYGSLEPRRALEIAAQCTAALAAAHKVGIVHRDLKPSNIFLTTTRSRADMVKIIDFGISKVIHQVGVGADLTSASKTVGTPSFMSPEQACGEKLDGRADIYSLGIILFAMLTGELPFRGSSALEILNNHLTQERVGPSKVNPGLAEHPALDQLVLGAIQIDPAQRYSSMEAFGEAIQACAEGLDDQPPAMAATRGAARESTMLVTPLAAAKAAPVGKRTSLDAASGEVTLIRRAAPSRARPLILAAIIIAVVGLGVGGWFAVRGGSSGSTTSEPAPVRDRATPASPSPAVAESEPAASESAAPVNASAEPAGAVASAGPAVDAAPAPEPRVRRSPRSDRKPPVKGERKSKPTPGKVTEPASTPTSNHEPEGTFAVKEW